MKPRGAETLEAFLRWMYQGGPIRSPHLYGDKTDGTVEWTTPKTAPPVKKESTPPPPPPVPVDRKSMAAGDDWDAAEVIEDRQEEESGL